jgi:hypothetical protein
VKTILACIALCAFGTTASACEIYTSELWAPGDRTVTFSGDGFRIVDKQHEMDDTYRIVAPGTGFPYSAGINEKRENNVVHWREYKDVIIIDMEVFEPYCPKN